MTATAQHTFHIWLSCEFARRNHTKGRSVMGNCPGNRTRKFEESCAAVNTNSRTRNKTRSISKNDVRAIELAMHLNSWQSVTASARYHRASIPYLIFGHINSTHKNTLIPWRTLDVCRHRHRFAKLEFMHLLFSIGEAYILSWFTRLLKPYRLAIWWTQHRFIQI